MYERSNFAGSFGTYEDNVVIKEILIIVIIVIMIRIVIIVIMIMKIIKKRIYMK